MLDVPDRERESTIALLAAIEAISVQAKIHLFLDNAPYHHAIMVRNGSKDRIADNAPLHTRSLSTPRPHR